MAKEEISALEAAIDTCVDAVPVLPEHAPTNELDALTLAAFADDLARKIDPADVVRRRYGFVDDNAMLEYLNARPAVLRMIKERRAIWESNGSIQDRAREYAGVVVLESMPMVGAIILGKDTKPEVRIDGLKAMSRIAGTETPPGGKEGAPAGQQFTVNFLFSEKTKTISGTVVPTADAPTVVDLSHENSKALSDLELLSALEPESEPANTYTPGLRAAAFAAIREEDVAKPVPGGPSR